MDKLLLCSSELAPVPYYIEELSLHIYSIEELCYVVRNNMELLDPSFFDQELLRWLKEVLHQKKLAEELLLIRQKEGGLYACVQALAGACGYFSREELVLIGQELQIFENKTKEECQKIRADRLLLHKRYRAAAKEYRCLLHQPQVGGILCGNIWHNLGTAYAGLFCFKEAADCFSIAYEKNHNPGSLRQKEAAEQLAGETALTGAGTETDVMRADRHEGESVEQSTEKRTEESTEKMVKVWKQEYRRS